MIDASFDSNCKCMDNGMHDTILLGRFSEGEYTLIFTLTDKSSFFEENIQVVHFEVTDFTSSINQKNIILNAFLYQNTPNPFSSETEIRYFLPENAGNAVLYVFSLNGNLMLTKPLTQTGNGSITISNSELQAGMYVYTLAIDGVEMDSKRMILTEK